MERIEEKIRGMDADMRLDRWLKQRFPALPHAMLVKELRKGNIRLNGSKAAADIRTSAKDIISFTPFIEQADRRAAEEQEQGNGPRGQKKPPPKALMDVIQSSIIADDKHVLVLNKPAGMAVQGGTGIAHPIDDILRAIFPDTDMLPVHRLDRDTTGVLIFAKNRKKAAELSESLRMRETKKHYLAVLQGMPPKYEGTWMTFMRKEADAYGTEKMRSSSRPSERDDKKAISAYHVIEHVVKRYSLVRLTPITGRTHQLRVHAAGADCPIIGDFKYGYKTDINAPKNALLLHAAEITLPGGVSYRASPPQVFKDFCSKIGIIVDSNI